MISSATCEIEILATISGQLRARHGFTVAGCCGFPLPPSHRTSLFAPLFRDAPRSRSERGFRSEGGSGTAREAVPIDRTHRVPWDNEGRPRSIDQPAPFKHGVPSASLPFRTIPTDSSRSFLRSRCIIAFRRARRRKIRWINPTSGYIKQAAWWEVNEPLFRSR